MPRKWKVHVMSRKCSAKARSNWRSLYSCVSWFNKVSKKVPKPASLMMFFMLVDNATHALFNIRRLPRLLWLCNTKVQHINFHDQTPHDQKIPYPKNILTTNAPTKFYHNQNFFTYPYTTTKFFHSHAKKKISHMTKIALKKIPTSSCTNKFSHSQNHNHTNFPRITSHNQQNFSHVQKLFIPTKFCHVHKTKFTYTNKLFPHISWTHSYKPNTNFSQCQYSQNPNQNSSKNITIYLHCQNSISLQHCPNCTMIKEKTTLEECSKVNIFKHDQSYNASKISK